MSKASSVRLADDAWQAQLLEDSGLSRAEAIRASLLASADDTSPKRWQNPEVAVTEFAEIAVEFRRRIEKTQWASMATVDSRARPRGRLVHPVWEEPVGWLATGRHSFKAQHLGRNPYVSLAYWDQSHEQVYIECRVAWVDDDAERQRLWDLYKTKPEGYPLEQFFKAPTHPEYGFLRIEPWRIELWNVNELFAGTPPTVWRMPLE